MRYATPLFVLLALGHDASAQVAWVKTFTDAQKQAAAEGKLIVVDVAASWCPPCQRMSRDVYPDAAFIEFSRSQVFMLVDAENEAEGVSLAGRYNVRVYPTILIIDPRGREIDRLVGGRTTRGLIDDLRRILEDPIPYEDALRRARAQGDHALLRRTGRHGLERGDYGPAQELLTRAVAVAANGQERIGGLVDLAVCCSRGGKPAEALKAIEELERADPKGLSEAVELRAMKGRALVALKRYDEGHRILQDILRSSRSRSELESARKAMAELPAKYRKADKELAALIAKARENVRKEKYDVALELATRAMEIAPQAAEVHLLLGAVEVRVAGQQRDADPRNRHLSIGVNELRLARRLDPDDLTGYQMVKSMLASRYMPYSPASPEAQKTYHEAEARFAEQRYEDAAKLYSRVIQLEPGFGKAYLHLGDCHYASGNLERALLMYRQTQARTPLDPAAYRFAADTLAKLGRSQEATDELVKSLLADPEYPVAWKSFEEVWRAAGREFERHHDFVPLAFLQLGIDVSSYDESMFQDVPAETVAAWREYVREKILWRQVKFARAFPNEAFYHTTFQEERDCLGALVAKWQALKRESPRVADDKLDFLAQVAEEDHLDAFIFLELFTEEYRGEYERWKKTSRATALAYIERYLLGPPRTDGGRGDLPVERDGARPAAPRRDGVESPVERAAAALSNDEVDEAIGLLDPVYGTLREGAEQDRANLILALAHFQAKHWKEAKLYAARLLERDPKNDTALRLLQSIREAEKR
jgi:tetratricopeptide (TPR) repeat protein